VFEEKAVVDPEETSRPSVSGHKELPEMKKKKKTADIKTMSKVKNWQYDTGSAECRDKSVVGNKGEVSPLNLWSSASNTPA
jgi:hypothetical protein